MQYIDFSKNGGLPLTQNALAFLQNAHREPLLAMAALLGNKVVVDGMAEASGNVAAGWFVYNGELIKFEASAIDAKVKITETLTSVEFEDGLVKAVYKAKTAVCDAIGDFDYSQLVRIISIKEAQTLINNLNTSVWRVGDVKEVDCTGAYVIANFDSTGLGYNERAGWAVCNGQNGTKDRQGRTSIGMQYPVNLTDPNNNVWDLVYNTIGSLVGENKHQLTEDELAEHQHDTLQGNSYRINAFSQDDVATVFFNDGNPNTASTTNFAGTYKTGLAGGNEKHENRQPSIVTLFIQKI